MKLVFGLFLSLLLSTSIMSAQKDIKKGKKLFNANCAACHKLDKKLIGPALGGISDRRKFDWVKDFIKDNKAMIARGDKDAIEVYNKFNKIPMMSYSFLSDEEISNIIHYLDNAN